ncbi:hypothetical protein [Singulisphaera sp. PoT]|uniref:hypothetical protein n=1 Tax=Singulisphaera sp. PoT TaxID=3411797 RepID=UPI003BF4D097
MIEIGTWERAKMCGIAGAMDLVGRREFPAERLLAMTRAIAHRGPDDEAVHIEPGMVDPENWTIC